MTGSRRAIVWTLSLWILAGNSFADNTQTSSATPPQRDYLVFGFLPIVSPERLVKRFAPLVNYLSTELGTEIRMETAPDFAQFVQRTQNETRYDILFTAPHLYYLANQQAAYRALAKVGADSLEAVIVTRTQGDIHTIDDLKGKRLATAGSLALSTLLTRQLLLHKGLNPDQDLTLVATPSQNASLLSTLQGTTDASALILPVYRRARPQVLQNTRVIAHTGKAPHIPIAAAPWLDATIATRLQTVLITMSDNEKGRAVLQALEWPGFVTTSDATYQSFGPVIKQIKVTQ
ncbi:hypothetical protein MNBD_GAMMA13-1270 [hydrothermal vent metagenome]|uniref:Uncharacterized protein n=1 Tax=hydrothermal vent metagenome TaxID=652676 RepID=A0A3B0YCE6_9ZZZZ